MPWRAALDFLGASLAIAAEYETVGITARMRIEHFDEVLDILADCLRSPTFPADEMTKALGRLRGRLTRDAQDIRDRAHRELFAQLFPPDHPLHRHPRGRIPDLATITREDLVGFHRSFYRPERTVLVVMGDLTPEQARASVERAFGGWARLPEEPTPARAPMPQVPASRRHTVTLPGKSEAFVMLGGNGIPRNDPDYYPTFLASRILGGGLASRLMRALREQSGLTYGVYSYFHPFLGERPWIISLQTGPQNVDLAIEAALAEARRLRDDGVTAEELQDAKAEAIGALALSLEDQMGEATVYRDIELLGLGLDLTRRFPDEIRAVTADQVQAAARAHLHPDRMIQIVVTPPLP